MREVGRCGFGRPQPLPLVCKTKMMVSLSQGSCHAAMTLSQDQISKTGGLPG